MMKSALQVPRSIAFYIAFYGGTVLCLLAVAAVTPFSTSALRALVRTWGLWHRWCARRLLGIHLRIEGSIPDEPVLFAYKHESFFEAIDLPAQLRLPAVFIKVELARLPLWGRASTRWGNVPVERSEGARALRSMRAAALERAAEGRPLVIFPEGTRVPHGSAPPLQSGFAGLYKLLALPVVPVAVNSGPLYHRRWKRPGTITVRFGEPIPPGLPRAEVEALVHRGINLLNR